MKTDFFKNFCLKGPLWCYLYFGINRRVQHVRAGKGKQIISIKFSYEVCSYDVECHIRLRKGELTQKVRGPGGVFLFSRGVCMKKLGIERRCLELVKCHVNF